MELARRLAQRLVDRHPGDAAGVLEKLPARDAAQTLHSAEATVVARVLQGMSAHHAAAVLQLMARAEVTAVLNIMAPDAAANLLRRCDSDFRDDTLAHLEGRTARTVRTLLSHASDTAATRMDPQALALPDDITVEAAIAEVRKAAANVLFNLYVVDRDHLLVGVLNLRELLVAPRKALLRDVMNEPTFRIGADSDRRAIFEHPGWRAVHSLPVVDTKGRFLGALRYRTLQRIQAETARPGSDRETVRSLGNLFWTGAAGVVDALTMAVGPDTSAGGSDED